MKRVLIVVGLIAAAGAGAYGQVVLKTEKASADVLQTGVMYRASFCSGTGSFGVQFDLKVTRLLNDKWFEADFGQLNNATKDFYGPPDKGRFNLTRLCYVKPIVP